MRGIKASSIDEYLDTVPESKRVVLKKLRGIIRSAAPMAEECITYHIPTYKLNGSLVGFGDTSKHLSFYVMSPAILDQLKKELSSFVTSKGTIQFTPDNQMPAALVRRIVKMRIAENAELAAMRPARSNRRT